MSNNLTFEHATNVSDPVGFFFKMPNEVTSGAFSFIFITTIFAVSFISMQRFGVQNSLTASSLLTMVVAVFLGAFNAVSSTVVMFTMVLFIAGIVLNRGDRV